MQRSSTLLASIALLALSGFASAATSPYIGVQLTGQGNGGGSPLGSSAVAGLVSQSNFNVGAGQSGSVANLVDSTGASTGASLTWTADDSWTTGTTASGPNGAGDAALLSGEDKTRGTATYTLANVPAGTYNLIVYTVNDVRNEGVTTVTTGSASGPSALYNVDETGGDWNSNPNYVDGGSTISSTSLTPGNYVQFAGVSPDSTGTLVFTHAFAAGIGSDTVSTNGFQLVSAPEPASLAMLGIAAFGLLSRRRRLGAI